MAKENLAYGTGRRKTSIARVYLRSGSGEIIVNGKPVQEYFKDPTQIFTVRQPMIVTDNQDKYNVYINVIGGGLNGQAGACRHGLSRALVIEDETNSTSLKANGFLTRDARMKERKKYGQRGARRKFQFSKR